ncbi:MAG: SRPBCC domain-containing protein [Pseudomonadota bacterium]
MFEKPSLMLRRRIKAPVAKVYEAWTDPAKLMKWWGPGDCEAISANADPCIGGQFRIVFKEPGPDGEVHDVSGTYDDVVPNEKLSFSWMWRTMPERQSHVTITLQSEEEGRVTVLTLYHEQFFDQAACDSHRGGWSSALDKLETCCEDADPA